MGIDQPEQRIIYHYTDDRGAYGIIESQSVWATHFRYLNDPGELRIFREALAHWRKSRESRIRPVDLLLKDLLNGVLGGANERAVTEGYVASFCDDGGDRLSQWRAYGRGGGYSLGFDRAELETLLEEEHKGKRLDSTFIGRAFYGNNTTMPKEIADDLDKCVNILEDRLRGEEHDLKEAVGLFVKCLSSFKHEGFSEEQEVRLISFTPATVTERSGEEDDRAAKIIKFRSGDGTLIPYIELFGGRYRLPLRQIIVGPSSDTERKRRSIQILAESKQIDPEIIKISRIPYRGR